MVGGDQPDRLAQRSILCVATCVEWRRSGPPVTRKHIVGLESPCRAIIHYHMATVRMWVILNLNIIYCYLCGGGAGIKWPSGYARLAIP